MRQEVKLNPSIAVTVVLNNLVSAENGQKIIIVNINYYQNRTYNFRIVCNLPL